MTKAAMKLALEALLHCKDAIVERGLNGSPEFAEKWGLTLPLERADQAITALREALAKQPAQQEPVAWYDEEDDCAYTAAELDGGNVDGLLPLYTSPPARKPLTDDQKEKLWCDKFDGDTNFNSFYSITEAIEAAHGIKENT